MRKAKSYIEIDLRALRENLGVLKSFIKESTKVLGVIKANGYGLGAYEVCKELIKGGVKYFGVALLEEGILLREQGIKENILLFSPYTEEEIPYIIGHNLLASVIDLERGKILNDAARKANKLLSVHLKVDTGMGRLGTDFRKSKEFIEGIKELKNLKVVGIYSHFASADIGDIEYTNLQITRFKEVISVNRGTGDRGEGISYHISNSSGIVCFSEEAQFDMVRPGLLLYGAYPSDYIKERVKVDKVVNVKSTIVSLKELSKGESVSYGRTYKARNKVRIGIIPLGYADGFSTLLSNKGEVIIKGKRVKVVGRVCMDYTAIDVSDVKGAGVGDEVTILGDGITEEEQAKLTGQIPYEILTSLSRRLVRVYKK